MIAILSLTLILFISILVTKIATAVLTNTGLSRQAAKFQARSAFTGAGFTTTESEKITRHPIRRRIIYLLMLLGNAGLVTVMASIFLTFINHDEKSLPWYYAVLIILGAVGLLGILASSHKIDVWLTRIINKVLGRYTNLSNRDSASLYKLSGDYHITELQVREGDWIEGQTLEKSNLRNEGISILGIERTNGSYLGVPDSETLIEKDDVLILYGQEKIIKKLDTRKKGSTGDKEHESAMKQHKKLAKIQDESVSNIKDKS